MRRLRFAALYTAAWVPLAVIYALLISMRGASPGESATAALRTVSFAAALGVGVWYLGSAISWPGVSRPRFFALHALFAAAYSAIWAGSVVLQIALYAPPSVLLRYLQEALGWQLVTGVILYGLLAGVAYSVRVAHRLREQEATAARAEALRARAELQALRAQLNPHFLFNTLHSITALVRSEPRAVEDALERFAGLLRYVIDVNREPLDDVPLADELRFVRDYLALERLRLGERLRIVEEVDPDALDCTIPAFSLQPLVENAIRHGIAPRARGGTLRLSARVEDDTLLLEVGDDGPGAVPADALAAEGLGLRLVRQRLLTRHPGRARLEVISASGSGFIVRIETPAAEMGRRAALAPAR